RHVEASRHAIAGERGEELRGGADDDIWPGAVGVPVRERPLEGKPVVGAAPVIALVGSGPEPEEGHAINLLADRRARSSRGAARVAAGVEVEVGGGDGDVPVAAGELAGELVVAGAAAVGGGDGEVVDPEEVRLLRGQVHRRVRYVLGCANTKTAA